MATVCHTDEETRGSPSQVPTKTARNFVEEQSEKRRHQEENRLTEARRYNQRKKTEMVGACPTNGGFQNPTTGHAVGTERIQEETGTAKGELDGHHETQPEEHGYQLGGGRRVGSRQDGMASMCGPMHL